MKTDEILAYFWSGVIVISILAILFATTVKADTVTLNFSQCNNYTIFNETDNSTANLTICAPDQNVCAPPPAVNKTLGYNETFFANNVTVIAPPYPRLNEVIQFTWADIGVLEKLNYTNEDLNLTVLNTPKPMGTDNVSLPSGESISYDFLQLKDLQSISVSCLPPPSQNQSCIRNLVWNPDYGETNYDSVCNITCNAPDLKTYDVHKVLAFAECYTNTEAKIQVCAPSFPKMNLQKNLTGGQTYTNSTYALNISCAGNAAQLSVSNCRPFCPVCPTNKTNATCPTCPKCTPAQNIITKNCYTESDITNCNVKVPICLSDFRDTVCTTDDLLNGSVRVCMNTTVTNLHNSLTSSQDQLTLCQGQLSNCTGVNAQNAMTEQGLENKMYTAVGSIGLVMFLVWLIIDYLQHHRTTPTQTHMADQTSNFDKMKQEYNEMIAKMKEGKGRGV